MGKKPYVLGLVLLFLTTMVPCLLSAQAPADSTVIYTNSFESPEDTTGWIGLSPDMFVADPAPGEGTYSLLIGGGCTQPTAWIDIPCTTGVATFCLSFWGKAGLVTPYGGSVSLAPADWYLPDTENLTIGTDSLNWRYYQAEKDFYLDRIDTLQIQIWAGGFIYDDVQIDGLEVVAWPLLAAESPKMQPETFTLHPAYPNPFNPATTLRYALPSAQYVILKVYDLMGRETAALVDRHQPAGEYQLLFDAGHLPSGIYLARFTAGVYQRSIKMLLVK